MCCAMLMLLQSVIEEDQGWLPSAPLELDVEYDDNRDQRDIASHISKHQHNPYLHIPTYSHIHIQ